MTPLEIYTHQDEVRDNETDLAGVVNNANYFIYMAHTRHKHIHLLGIDFAEMFKSGYMLVVAKAEITYKLPLVAGDQYQVSSKVIVPKPRRMAFEHIITRLNDGKVCATGLITAACVNNETKRPEVPELLIEQLDLTTVRT